MGRGVTTSGEECSTSGVSLVEIIAFVSSDVCLGRRFNLFRKRAVHQTLCYYAMELCGSERSLASLCNQDRVSRWMVGGEPKFQRRLHPRVPLNLRQAYCDLPD